MFNTPLTYAIYIAGLVFKWLKRQGGLAAIEQKNIAKAQALYAYLDQSGFYASRVAPGFRSRMNVPFVLADESLNEQFLAQSRERSEAHTSELQSLMPTSYAFFCLKKKN